MKATFGAQSVPAAGALGTIAKVEMLAGQLESSELHYSEALRIMREQGIFGSDVAIAVMSGYATLLRKMRRRHDAEAIEAELKPFRGRN